MASMDGRNMSLLFANGRVSQPNGLAIDFETDTLYLIDAHLDYITKSGLYGSDFEVIYSLGTKGIARVFGQQMDFYRGKLYFGDRFEDTVYRFDVYSGSLDVVVELMRDPGNVRVVHVSRQPQGVG